MKSIGRFLIVFVVFSIPVFAGDLTLFAGGTSPGKITLSRVTSGATETLSDPMKAGLFGLRFGGGRVFGHEQTIAYAPNFLESSSKAIFMNSNLVIQAPLPVFKPYATAGLGTIFSWGSGVGDIGAKLALNYGGGIKLLPAGPVGVRFDARGYSAFGVQDQTLKLGEVSVGVLFSF